jgi:hypothetical protein
MAFDAVPHHRRQPLEEVAHRLRRRQRPGGGGRRRLVGDAHRDAAAVAGGEGAEGVLVGDVVADVDRQHLRSVELQRGEQVEQRPALVPVEAGAQLDHLLALGAGEPRVVGQRALDRRLDLADAVLRHPPVVDGDGEALRLHLGAGHRRQLAAQPLGHPRHQRRQVGRRLVTHARALRAGDVEAVAARVDELGQAHPCRHVAAVAAGDDDHRRAAGERRHRLAHPRQDGGVRRPLDDRRQGAVEVEEDHRPPPGEPALDLAPAVQRRGDRRGGVPLRHRSSSLRCRSSARSRAAG